MHAPRLFALLLLTATPALSDTYQVQAPVTAVTLYPYGATVARDVTFTATPGAHTVIVPDLPWDLDAQGLRVTAPDGVTVGAISLAEARPPAGDGTKPDTVLQAEAEVARLEAVLRTKAQAIAVIRATGEAAAARAAFLQDLARARGEASLTAATVSDLRALASLVGEEVLAARTAVLEAEAQAVDAEIALKSDEQALTRAQSALAVLVAPPEGQGQALTLSLQTSAGGPVTLTVDTLVDEAGWSPTYDLRLTRGPDVLLVTRGVLVRQDTGEDWRGVALTLSTARPSEQGAPSALWPDLRRIVSQDELDRAAPAEGSASYADAPAAEPVMAAPAAGGFGFDTAILGQVFAFTFGAPVDIRTGADALRLVMDQVAPQVTTRADAVPMIDATAFLVAEITNTTGQPLLPGPALLYSEGALVGGADLPLVATGAKADVGFGAIDGLRLTRIVPGASEGARGIITSSNRREEQAILTIENLTATPWPVTVTDRIPYSEQDDLSVTYVATPAVTEENPKGQRGLLVWRIDLAPGAKQDIRLQTRLDWPDGMTLQ